MLINNISFGSETIFSAELITELEEILKKDRCIYLPRDLQKIGLDIAKYVFMKELSHENV